MDFSVQLNEAILLVIVSMRQEMYSRAQPIDSTVTARTKLDNGHLQNREYYFGRGNLNGPYCCQLAGVLRILEIVGFFFS
ncbi:unnamed protein product [Litomosoides sigmodontis]|uniref:Uncharacterized protein n=1 Tax=Litomosoides sigmodontis TaxID=42156 RepID=A0A3P6V202_LITSI|nr:unnamed protein product [Litomosoides sigmodontis]